MNREPPPGYRRPLTDGEGHEIEITDENGFVKDCAAGKGPDDCPAKGTWVPEKPLIDPRSRAKKIFIDLHGVVVDHAGYLKDNKITAEEATFVIGAYAAMKPLPGAIEAVRELIKRGWDVWLATMPPEDASPNIFAELAAWIQEWLPECKEHFVITYNKGMLGTYGDYLIDDRPHKANCKEFQGNFFPFVNDLQWETLLNYFRARDPMTGRVQE